MLEVIYTISWIYAKLWCLNENIFLLIDTLSWVTYYIYREGERVLSLKEWKHNEIYRNTIPRLLSLGKGIRFPYSHVLLVCGEVLLAFLVRVPCSVPTLSSKLYIRHHTYLMVKSNWNFWELHPDRSNQFGANFGHQYSTQTPPFFG